MSALPPKADITTAGTGIYLHRQKIAEAHTMFAELPSILRRRLRRDNDGSDAAWL